MEDDAQVVQDEIQQQKHDLTQHRVELEFEKTALNVERIDLLRRLAEIDTRLKTLSHEMTTLEQQERQLCATLNTVKSQFDQTIRRSIYEQQKLADCKMNSCSLLSLVQITQDVYEDQFSRQRERLLQRHQQRSNQLARSLLKHLESQRSLFSLASERFEMERFDASWTDTKNLASRALKFAPIEATHVVETPFVAGDVVEAHWNGTPAGYYLCEINAIRNQRVTVNCPRPDGLHSGCKTVMVQIKEGH